MDCCVHCADSSDFSPYSNVNSIAISNASKNHSALSEVTRRRAARFFSALPRAFLDVGEQYNVMYTRGAINLFCKGVGGAHERILVERKQLSNPDCCAPQNARTLECKHGCTHITTATNVVIVMAVLHEAPIISTHAIKVPVNVSDDAIALGPHGGGTPVPRR